MAPVVVLVSFAIGHPMTLFFNAFEPVRTVAREHLLRADIDGKERDARATG